MGAKGSVEAAKINAQNWNNLEVRYGPVGTIIRCMLGVVYRKNLAGGGRNESQ